MKFSKANKVFTGIALALAIGLGWWWFGRAKVTTPEGLQTGVVKKQDLVQRITISGPVSAKRRLDVKTSFVGFVQKIYVKVGENVKPGDPLVTFSPSLSQAESNYPVRATFAGKVTQVLKIEGEYVTETGDQSLVLRVEDLSELRVVASVPELDIAKVKIGQTTNVKISALVGETFNGEIRQIALSARDKDRWSSSSTEFQVEILLKTHDPRLFPGVSALCDVVTNKVENALVLPHEYMQVDADEKYFVTRENGQKQYVVLGLQTDEGAEIKEGLKEGDKVRLIDFLNLPKVEE